MWFWSLWWLIFPVMFFAKGALRMWLRYKRRKDNIDLMKTYAAQGKDPAEIARILGINAQVGAPPFASDQTGMGDPAGDFGGPFGYWRCWEAPMIDSDARLAALWAEDMPPARDPSFVAGHGDCRRCPGHGRGALALA